jgi:hypothetical protein
MSKSGLRILAVLLTVAIVVVIFAGLDGLPRDVKAQIAGERKEFAAAQTHIRADRDEVSSELAKEAALFNALPSAHTYPDRLTRAERWLGVAATDLDQLGKLEKQNRHKDREEAERLISHAKQTRTAAIADADLVRKDAAHWIELKQHLPQEAKDMDRDYQAMHAVDLAALAAAVQKAESDWPAKKSDLETRLANVRGMIARGDEAWQSTEGARRAAASNDYAKVDFATLFPAADTLKTSATELPKQAEQLKTLSGQLYQSWDKILEDMEVRGSGSDKSYDQKIQTVTTQLSDATAKASTATSDEKWVDVSKAQYEAQEKNLGMAIEHKPAGKYDTESERVAQPAGFAYMAPYGQSNQYGHWEGNGGNSFWVFYGQYALMRDLLFHHDYRPFGRYDYDEYYTYRSRNQTYYGRDAATQAPRYGTSGTATQEHYAGSTFAKSGGFKDSKYASKPGGYRDSNYATPMAKDPNGDHSPRKFGTGSSQPQAPPAQHSYRPAPAPYRPSAPRSPGRSFGRPRR